MGRQLTAEEHLLRVIALCQLPHSSWTPSDREVLGSAREFIKQKQEERALENRYAEGSHRAAEPGRERQDSKEVGREVRADLNPFEEGSQDPEEAGGGT